MQKFSILFSLLGSMAFAAAEVENPTLKGVLIVDNSSKVRGDGIEHIEGVQFDGIQGKEALVEQLTPFLSDYPLTANGAEALCSTITQYYHEHEDLRVAVTVPDQNTSDGVVQLIVAPEKLGRVRVKDNAHTKSDTLKQWVRLSKADPINEKTLTQDIGWMNTNPYRTVKADYQSTKQPGVTDVHLLVSDKKNWKISTGVENTGNMPIGTTRIFAGLNANNFIFTDHTLQIKATTADHWKEYQSYSADYVALLPWRNILKISGSYSSTTPDREPYPHKNRESFQTTGRYEIPHWFGSNPWINQITYGAGVEFKGTNTNLFDEDTPEPVKKMLAFALQFTTGVNMVRERDGNKITAGLDLVGSPARLLPHQTDADFENLRAGATPQYFYSKVALGLEQALIQEWNLAFQGKGQFAFADLIPSEQCSLGGFSTVRGYDEKVVGGDNSVYGQLELRSPKFSVAGLWLPKLGDQLNFLGFVDGGYAWFRNKVEATPLEQSLLSVGPGMRYSISSYFTSRLDVGFPLLKVEKDSGNPRLHFSAVMSY